MPDDVSKRIEKIRSRLVPALACGKWRQVRLNGKLDADVTTSPSGIVDGDKLICDCRSGSHLNAARDGELARFIAHAPDDMVWLLGQLDEFLGRDEPIGYIGTETSVAVKMRYTPKESSGLRRHVRPRIEILNRSNGSELGILSGKPATAMRKDLELPCREFVDGELFLMAQLPRPGPRPEEA